MKTKKLFQTALIGAGVLAMAGNAAAVQYDINIYGASAQYLFWTDAAKAYCAAQTGWTINVPGAKNAGNTQGLTKCTAANGDVYYFRYTSKNSSGGVSSIQGQGTDGSCSAYQRPFCGNDTCSTSTCQDVTLGASDVASSSFTQTSRGNLNGPAGGGFVTRGPSAVTLDPVAFPARNNVIVPFGFFAHNSVHVNRCVTPDPFTPDAAAHKAISTWGNECYDLHDDLCRFNAAAPDGGRKECLDTNSFPFTFTGQTCNYSADCAGAGEDNKSSDCIGYYKCIGNVCSGGLNVGNACTTVENCPDATTVQTRCERMPIDNISRLMAVLIYSGQAINWQDFGKFYDVDLPSGGTGDYKIQACLRHAGSGTHSTLDWAVMRSTKGDWGKAITQNQCPTANPLGACQAPGATIWYNDGSTQMMNCINGLTSPAYDATGAIGYADCDQLVGTANYPNVHALKYNGVECRRWKVRNGEYDFFSQQFIYADASEVAHSAGYYQVTQDQLDTAIDRVLDFAENPANIPGSKIDYWASKGEMKVLKTNDRTYPIKATPTTTLNP